jgi:hypothetical protein
MSAYAHPEVLVTTDWVASHAKDANVAWWKWTSTPRPMTKATCPARSPGPGTRSFATPWFAIFCRRRNLKL